MKTWLLLDTSYLAYRAFYTTGDLSYEGARTGVPFGVLRDVLNHREMHRADRVIFCFDRGKPRRCELDHRYKNKESKGDDDLREAKTEVGVQLDKLRTEHLPEIGFSNVFGQSGFEGDDVIAGVCEHLPDGVRAVIVSADEDLWQLLRKDRVVAWNPKTKRATTEESFTARWGIGPAMWADVKALAGCSGDNVIGIAGVGNLTAVRYLTGQLRTNTKAWHKIVYEGRGVWEHNLKLTRLPLPGLKRFVVREDEDTPERWLAVLGRLGIKSLMERMVT